MFKDVECGTRFLSLIPTVAIGNPRNTQKSYITYQRDIGP